MLPPALLRVLETSRERGFLGPGPVEDHVVHAQRLAATFPAEPGLFVDLGSGGGVPGLVIACERAAWRGVLLEGSVKRSDFLQEAVGALSLGDRLEVWSGRAEDFGKSPENRGRADVVVARSFGLPAVVAECAAPLLRIQGRLIVSDPPAGESFSERWPDEGLRQVGLEVVAHHAGPPAHTELRQALRCPDRFPRRVGIPAKRPIF